MSIFFALLIPLGSLFAQEGISYSCIEIPNRSWTGFFTGSQWVHVLWVNPSLYQIKLAKALDQSIGRESVLSLSKRHGALAAINGGFFKVKGLWQGAACGALKIQDWYALPSYTRGCLGWSLQDQIPKMDRLMVRMKGCYAEAEFTLDGLNRERQEGEAILFTPSFYPMTLTVTDGEEVLIQEGVIQSITRRGNVPIPENSYIRFLSKFTLIDKISHFYADFLQNFESLCKHMVEKFWKKDAKRRHFSEHREFRKELILSVQEKHPLYGLLRRGGKLSFSTKIDLLLERGSEEKWNSFEYVIGGAPLLLYEGSKVEDVGVEKILPEFLQKRYARTAVGILPDHKWVFVVVQKSGLFDGMTIDELTSFLQKLGCMYALNLDGGGSSTMVYEGSVKNSFFGDENEIDSSREVSDAILILPRKREMP